MTFLASPPFHSEDRVAYMGYFAMFLHHASFIVLNWSNGDLHTIDIGARQLLCGSQKHSELLSLDSRRFGEKVKSLASALNLEPSYSL